jgi:deazaflavin-dependent oxidoreductase (nitroreductase family)
VIQRQPIHPVVRWVLRVPLHLYHWHVEWLLGHRFLMLVHTGRRSGLERRTVLEVVHYDDATGAVVVMSGFGRRSDWYQNIQTHPATKVVVGRRSFVPTHRDLSEDEAIATLADYERRNRIAAPVVRWALSRLVGWRYDGSEASRRRLVKEHPLVLFTPTDTGEPTPHH